MCEEGGTGEVAGEDGRDGERENGNGAREDEEISKPESLGSRGGKEDDEVGGAQALRGWVRDGMCCHSASETESGLRLVSTFLSKPKSTFRDGREVGVQTGSRSMTTGAADDDSFVKSISISSPAALPLLPSRPFPFQFSRLFLAIGNSIVGASRTISVRPLQGAGPALL